MLGSSGTSTGIAARFRRSGIGAAVYALAFFSATLLVLALTADGDGSFEPPVATFEGLGDLHGGAHASVALGISGDGQVVVGYGRSAAGDEAFRWEGGVMTGLGGAPGGDPPHSVAHAASRDGSVVVGSGTVGGTTRALVWRDGEVRVLGRPVGAIPAFSDAWAVSADGSVVVGEATVEGAGRAVVWRDGMPALLDDPAGGLPLLAAYGVSADGSVIVGAAGPPGGQRGFRLAGGAAESVPVPEVDLDDVTESRVSDGVASREVSVDGVTVRAVSADGLSVVGVAGTVWGTEGFRWRDGSSIGLGGLAMEHEVYSGARDVSADGSVVVGASDGAAGGEAFVWDRVHGMRSLREVLVHEHGLDLAGWTLEEATAVSDDGLAIAGYGRNPDGETEGWIARLPPGAVGAECGPRPCRPPGVTLRPPTDSFGEEMDVAGRWMAVTRPARGAIDLFDLDAPGEPLAIASAGGYGEEAGRFVRPSGVALDPPRGRLIAGDSEALRLQVFELPGEARTDLRLLRAVKTAGMLAALRPGERVLPTEPGALAVGGDGGVFLIDVANRAVIALDEQLAPRRVLAPAGGGRFEPVDLGLDPRTGRLLVLDGASGKVAVFGRDGEELGGFDLPAPAAGDNAESKGIAGGDIVARPHGIAVDGDGSVWIVVGPARVVHLDERGRLVHAFGRPGLGAGELREPRAVALDGRGRLVVLDWGNHRAMVFARDGSFLDAFGGGLWSRPARSARPPGAASPAPPPAPASPLRPPSGDLRADPDRLRTGGGAFVVELSPSPAAFPLNELFALRVRVLDGAGRALAPPEVELAVDAGMPRHRHGMTTRPEVVADPDGGFTVRGLLLHMPGEWLLTLDVTRGGVTERAELEVTLE